MSKIPFHEFPWFSISTSLHRYLYWRLCSQYFNLVSDSYMHDLKYLKQKKIFWNNILFVSGKALPLSLFAIACLVFSVIQLLLPKIFITSLSVSGRSDVMTAMLVYSQENNFDDFFCFWKQHGRYAYCLLFLLGLCENLYKHAALKLNLLILPFCRFFDLVVNSGSGIEITQTEGKTANL